jgi:hypothetical protein
MIVTVGIKVVGEKSVSVPLFATQIPHTKWAGTETVPAI